MIDTFVTFRVLPGKTEEFEAIYSFAGAANRSETSDVGGSDTSESVTR